MKHLKKIIFAALLLALALSVLVACDMFKGNSNTTKIPIPGGTVITECEEHDWSVLSDTASCVSDGMAEYKCTKCNEQKTEYSPAKGHTESIIPAVSATCETEGYTEGKECSKCGYRIQEPSTIFPSHTFVEMEPIDATCTTDGRYGGSVCSVCDYINYEPSILYASHSYEYVPGLNPTCTTNGYASSFKCTACGEYEVEPEVLVGQHEYVTVYGWDATCFADGMTDGEKCVNCGDVKTPQTVIPSAHTDVQTTPGTPATCQKEGLTDGSQCITCGTVLVEMETIPVKAHNLIAVNGYNATCTASGLTAGEKCSDCGTITSAQSIIHTGGHSFATDGKCSGCNLAATALKYEEYTVARSADGISYVVIGIEDGFEGDTIVIPDTFNGYPVVKIAAGAFAGNTEIKKVVVPSTVTEVEDNAFKGCTALETIEVLDYEQIENWNTTLSDEGLNLKFSTSLNYGKAPYELYLKAMMTVGAGMDRYVLNVSADTYFANKLLPDERENMLHMESITAQWGKNCYIKNLISYNDSQYMEDELTEIYYVDGWMYMPYSYNGQTYYIKSEVSYEYLMGSQDPVTNIIFDAQFFQFVSFYTTSDGKHYLEIHVGSDSFNDVYDAIFGSDDGDIDIYELIYTYTFDQDYNIESYYCSASYYVGKGTDDYGNPIDVIATIEMNATFSYVGTFMGYSVPNYDWLDGSTPDCESVYGRDHNEVIVEAIEPTCALPGRTEGSYCATCMHTITPLTILPAGHNYIDGICQGCGMAEE